MSCVRIREISHVPRGHKRIEWSLYSTYRVTTFSDAVKVARSYAYRWSIEEFHKTWKTGAWEIESSQLRSYEALHRWGVLLATVAARVERLKKLSREQPNIDALTEFSRHELDAAIVLSQTKTVKVGEDITLNQAVRLVAMVGGYTGRKRDGPPGSITIRRGLNQVIPAAIVLAAQSSSG